MELSSVLLPSILIAAVLYNIALVVVILTQTRPHQSGRWFVWYILSVSAWIACEALLDLPAPYHVSGMVALWSARAMFFFGMAIGIFTLWFCATFPRDDRRLRPIATLLTGIGLPWAVLSWTPMFIVSAPRLPYSDHLVIHAIPTMIYGAWLMVCMIVSLIHLIMKARRVTGIERMQVRYLLFGMVIMIVPSLLFNLFLPALLGTTANSQIGPLSTIAFTTAVTYVIVRYRMMDISLVITRGATYTLTLVAISLLFALLVQKFDYLLTHHGFFQDTDDAQKIRIISFIVALLMVLAFPPVLRALQAVVDRAFFRSVYDYRRTIYDAGDAFASAHSSPILVELLITTLDQTMRPAHVVVYLPNGEGEMAQVSSTSRSAHMPTGIALEDPVIEYLVAMDQVLVADELRRRGEPHLTVGREITGWGTQLIIPFMVAGRLNGMACLGDKQSGDPFTAEDLDLLHTLGRQAAVALDNFRHYDELLRLNAELEQRVADRTRDLNTANLRLREADKAKDEFLAILPHELLTPLTSILGWAQVARETGDEGTTIKALEVIERNAQRQRRILDDLLDMSRIIHQKFSLVPERIDLWSIAQQCADSIQLTATHRNIRLELDPPTDILPIIADSSRLFQAVCNLLNNALKFTEPGGAVVVRSYQTGDMAVLEIRDTGRGIPQEMLQRIFTPFQQVDRHETKGGLGLGLALVKGIIELHGGEVYASSPGLHKGSTFTVALPLHRREEPIHATYGR